MLLLKYALQLESKARNLLTSLCLGVERVSSNTQMQLESKARNLLSLFRSRKHILKYKCSWGLEPRNLLTALCFRVESVEDALLERLDAAAQISEVGGLTH